MPHTPDKRKKKPSRVRSSGFPAGEAILEAPEARGLSITPLQLLGYILKAMLKDRITTAEIDKICSVYYDTLRKWFG